MKKGRGGFEPPRFAWQFPRKELDVLHVIAVDVGKAGVCQQPIEGIACRAEVHPGTVLKAVKRAQVLELLAVESNRRAPTIFRIISKDWQDWLRRPPLIA